MRHDMLADALSAIKNAEKTAKREVTVPASRLVGEVLRVSQSHGYIGQFEKVESKQGGSFKVSLMGKITACGAIKPRASSPIGRLISWEKEYLPSRDFGILILSTPGGIMSHKEAKQKGTGGILLSYFY